jgi:hypothetical protein
MKEGNVCATCQDVANPLTKTKVEDEKGNLSVPDMLHPLERTYTVALADLVRLSIRDSGLPGP